MTISNAVWLPLAAGILLPPAMQAVPAERTDAPRVAASSQAERSAPHVPLRFVENLGQWPGPARFVARRPGLALSLFPSELALDLTREGADGPRSARVRLCFEGAGEDAQLEGEEPSATTASFFLGSDPARWKTGVATCASVLYRGLLPGVELRVRDQDGWPEYDLLLEPGADLGSVALRCEGVERLELEPEGALVLHTAEGPLRQSAPVTWQVLPSGERRELASRHRLLGPDRFGFEVDAVDPELALVVDPGLVWASYFGGSGGEGAMALALTPTGALVVAGMTDSPDLPAPAGQPPVQPGNAGGEDGFVALFDPSGSTLLEMTYLGGAGDDGAYGVAVDGAGRVFVAGFTRSANFPTTAGAYDTTLSGAIDGFVSVLDFSLSGQDRLVYSSYFGGGSIDWIGAMRVDTAGIATVAGITQSPDLPTTPGAFDSSPNGGRDVFVARLDPSAAGAAQVSWCTYFGGSGQEGVQGPTFPSLPIPPQIWASIIDLALDGAGRVTVTASTASADLPVTPGAFRATYIGSGTSGDGFVATFDPTAVGPAQLLWSTYFGGDGPESAHSVCVTPEGQVAVGGYTYSPDFPLSLDAFDASFGGEWDGFLLVFDPAQSGAAQLVYGSYLGGSARDGVGTVRAAAPGVFVIVGTAGSPDLPTTPDAFDPTHNGGEDAFVTVLDTHRAGAAQLVYSSFLGGSEIDFGVGGELDSDGSLVLSGWTLSPDFPATQGSFMPSSAGATDVFVARFDLDLGPGTPYCFGDGSGTACPCGNEGSEGQGCANGSGQGAALSASGSTSAAADDLELHAVNLLASQPALCFAGQNALNGGDGVHFGDGLRCAGVGVVRLGVKVPNAAGEASWGPNLGATGNWQGGDTRRFQIWYRNPGTSPCGFHYNLSNGYEILFTP